MPGTMSRADLILDLKGILQDAADKFDAEGNVDFERHLTIAADAMGRKRPRTLVGSVTLTADKSNYTPPGDLVDIKYPLWGANEQRTRKPWMSNFPARLPRLSLVEYAGALSLWLDPAPTADQIADLGSTYTFFYFAAHQVSDVPANTTIQAADRSLLLTRATAQALLELANDGISKPVSLGTNSVGNMPKNGTPGALAEQWLKQFEAAA